MSEIILGVLVIALIMGGYVSIHFNNLIKSYSQTFGAETGKIDATTQKLEIIQNQLAQSVEITESIKRDIEQGAGSMERKRT